MPVDVSRLGVVPFVTVTPPAEYPEPDTSPVAVYAAVLGLMVAETRYNAALTVSVVGEVSDVRETSVAAPSWCSPRIHSCLKLWATPAEFAMATPP